MEVPGDLHCAREKKCHGEINGSHDRQAVLRDETRSLHGPRLRTLTVKHLVNVQLLVRSGSRGEEANTARQIPKLLLHSQTIGPAPVIHDVPEDATCSCQ